MKKVVEIIAYLKARDVELGLSGENIRFRGRKQALTPEIVDEMKSHKAEIISYLNLETAPDSTPLRNNILLGDSQERLKSVPDNSIDLMVTDPPYGIGFMGKDWDKALAQNRNLERVPAGAEAGGFRLCDVRPETGLFCPG